MDYEKLRAPQTAKELPIEFRKEFEEALSKAIGYWQQNGKIVDQFEDNAMECSFAKGFLAGCIYMESKKKQIMDYEEKYKTALERTKAMIKVAANQDEAIGFANTIFPELAESENEDEMIRKELIEHIKANKCADYVLFKKFSPDDVIAWLEKQNKQKEDARWELLEKLLEADSIYQMAMNDAMVAEAKAKAISAISKLSIFDLLGIEKQTLEPNWCHHKVDLSDCSEEYRKAYYDGWNNCNMQHSQCKSEGNDVVKCLINGMKFYCEDNEEATWGTEKFSMKVKDILDWLEKQKPIDENEFAKGVLIRIAMSIMQWLDANLAEGNMCLSNMECEDLENAVRNADCKKVYGYMKKKLEKQGVQKPTDTYCKENCKGYQETGKCYADGSCDAKIKAGQKPVWSEEDDKLFSLTLDMVEWYSGKNEKNSRTVSDWLKSLKQRMRKEIEL